MENKIANEIVELIKNRDTGILAIDVYNKLNIMNFLHELQFGNHIDFGEQIEKIEYEKTNVFPLDTQDLLFLMSHTDINKVGIYENNYNKTLSEFVIENKDFLNLDKVGLRDIIDIINAKTDFSGNNGYLKNYLEIALTVDDFLSDKNIEKILNEVDFNKRTGISASYHECGGTTLENILSDDDLVKKIKDFNYNVVWAFGEKIIFTDKIIELLIEKEKQLPSQFYQTMYEMAKRNYIETSYPATLIKNYLSGGVCQKLFNEDDFKSIVNNYFGNNYDVNYFNKEDKFKDFARKGNLIVYFVKEIKDLPEIINQKISEIESLPASDTLHYSDDSGKMEYNNVKKEFEKNYSNDVIYYLLQKAEESLKNASALTREKPQNKNIIEKIKEMKNKFAQQFEASKNKIK